MNIKGNELADKAAKIETKAKAYSQNKTVSLSFIKRNIKLNCLNKWTEIWNKKKFSEYYSQFETQSKWKASKWKVLKHI